MKNKITEALQEEIKQIHGSYAEENRHYIGDAQEIFEKIAGTGVFEDYDLNVVFGTLQNINESIRTVQAYEEVREDAPNKYGILKSFAEKLNNMQYEYPQIPKDMLSFAKACGIIIVTGASDDLMEFEGAMEDEGDCFDGGKVYFNSGGVLYDSENGLEEEHKSGLNSCIEALWCKEIGSGETASWSYKTEIPHEKFIIREDKDVYCEGIVFYAEDVVK